MLKKLIKHEWRNVGRVGVMMVLAMLIVTLLGWLSFKTPMWNAAFGGMDDYSFHVADLMGLLALLTYFLAIMAVSYGFTIYVAIHFYRSMYTDQGYLTHTLPVTPGQLMFSKVLVSSLWSMIIGVLVIVSVIALIASLITTMISASGENPFAEISMTDWQMVLDMLEMEMGFNLGGFIWVMIAMLLISPFSTIAIMFGSVTLGQLARNNKGLMGFVWYFVINMVIGIVMYVVEMLNMVGALTSTNPETELMNGLYINTLASTTVIMAVVAVILYLISIWINKKKINLI